MVDGEHTPEVRRLRSAVPPTADPEADSGTAPEVATPTPETATAPVSATPVAKTPEPARPAVDTVVEAPRRARRVRARYVHALRRFPHNRQTAAAAARSVRAWSGRPSGRLTLPALLLLALVALTGTAGAILVPAAAPAGRSNPSPDATSAATAPEAAGQAAPTGPALTLGPTTAPSAAAGGYPTVLPTGTLDRSRPADVLASWAQQAGGRAGIPVVAMQAYGYAELVLGQTTPGCRLTWTTLAAIGLVESNHGRANGAMLNPAGQSVPPIIGLPLDGKGGRQRIVDTDSGQLDNDRVLDRAIGPMQFIPSSWQRYGIDADNDGVKDPQDIDDSALAAGNYLCNNGRDLSTAQDWWNAILSYNDVRRYAQAVFNAANEYGKKSRT